MVQTMRGIVTATLLLLLSGVIWVRMPPTHTSDPPTAAIGGERQVDDAEPPDGAIELAPELAPDFGDPPAKNPLIRGVQELIGESPVFEEEGDDLLDQLDQADRVLDKIKQENRRALQRLRTRPRRGSNSAPPHFIVIELGEIGATELAAFGGDDKRAPFLAQLAQQGVLFTGFEPDTSLFDMRAQLWTGGTAAPVRDDRTASLLAALKAKQYRTILIGDCRVDSRWSTPSQAGFARWFGTVEESPFPQTVLDTGAEIRVLSNQRGSEGQSSEQLFLNDALSVFRNADPAKPLFVHLAWSFPKKGEATSEQWSDRIRQWDDGLVSIAKRLNESRVANNAIIILVGLQSRSVTDSGNAPLLIMGPNRVRKNRIDGTHCKLRDVAATIAEFADVKISTPGRSLAGQLRQ